MSQPAYRNRGKNVILFSHKQHELGIISYEIQAIRVEWKEAAVSLSDLSKLQHIFMPRGFLIQHASIYAA